MIYCSPEQQFMQHTKAALNVMGYINMDVQSIRLKSTAFHFMYPYVHSPQSLCLSHGLNDFTHISLHVVIVFQTP